MDASHLALEQGLSDIFDTDQDVQFTENGFIGIDGRGRTFKNIFIEILWHSVKYELLCTNEYPGSGSGNGPAQVLEALQL